MSRARTTYEYPRPAVTVDCVVFGVDEDALKILLIKRQLEPFRHSWALPGGFMRMDETAEQAAMRELHEETGVSNLYLEQLHTFSDVDRDPRTRVLTVAYYALAKLSDHRIRAATDAESVGWFPAEDTPALAFDHDKILSMALARLRGKVRYTPIGFELLPRRFTLSQLQRLYELILLQTLDKRNFRKKISGTGLIVGTDQWEERVPHRAARLYRFDRRKYQKLVKQGFNFAI
jgi:8-oxo-dGTP diphosphatase